VKLLLDACVWGKAAKQLREAGHDVVWVGDWPEDPGDDAILSFAHAEERILVTIDKDFGEWAVLRDMPHHGILRIVNFSAHKHAEVCSAVLLAHGEALLAGALVTAEPGRLRIRLP
jgi:predicted nuclease of predicted toxin-antitoxin system